MYNYTTTPGPSIFDPSDLESYPSTSNSRKQHPGQYSNSSHLMLPPSSDFTYTSNKGYLLSPLDSSYRPLGSFGGSGDFDSLFGDKQCFLKDAPFFEDPRRHDISDFASLDMPFAGLSASDESLIFNPSAYFNPAISIPEPQYDGSNALIQTPSFYSLSKSEQADSLTDRGKNPVPSSLWVAPPIETIPEWQGFDVDDFGASLHESVPMLSPYVSSQKRLRRAANVFNTVGLLETCGIISDTESDEEEDVSPSSSNTSTGTESSSILSQATTVVAPSPRAPSPPAASTASAAKDSIKSEPGVVTVKQEQQEPEPQPEEPRRSVRVFVNSSMSPKSSTSSSMRSPTQRKTPKRLADHSPRQAMAQQQQQQTRATRSQSNASAAAARRTTSGKTVKDYFEVHRVSAPVRPNQAHVDGPAPITRSDSSSSTSSSTACSSTSEHQSSGPSTVDCLSPLTQPATPLLVPSGPAIKRDWEEAELDEEPLDGGEADPDYDPTEDTKAASQLPQRRPQPRRRKRGSGTRKKGPAGPKPACQYPGCSATFTREADLFRHVASVHSRQTIEEVMSERRPDYRLWCLGCHKILARPDARSRHEEGCQKYLQHYD